MSALTEERCDWSDLIVSHCAHCRGLNLDLPTPPTVTARHPGYCLGCEGRIDVDDPLVRLDDGTYVCTGCAIH